MKKNLPTIIRAPQTPPAVPPQRSEVYVPKNESASVRYHSIYDNQQAVYDLQVAEQVKRGSGLKWALWIMFAIVVLHSILK